MFAPHCPTCRHRVLLGPRRVERITNAPGGPIVDLRCFCGTVLTWPPVADDEVPVESAHVGQMGSDPNRPAADRVEPLSA